MNYPYPPYSYPQTVETKSNFFFILNLLLVIGVIIISYFIYVKIKNKYDDCYKKSKCPIGEYNDMIDFTKCKKLPGGKYIDDKGILNSCPTGTYCPIGFTGTSPIDCPTDKFCNYESKEPKQKCKEGEYSTSTGCISCPFGTYSDVLGSSECKKCEFGTYQDKIGSNSCKKCDIGTYQDEIGSNSCKKCDIGTYQDEIGSNSCKICLSNYVCDNIGLIKPNSCPTGQYPNTGSTGCIPCEPGTYCAYCEIGDKE